MICNVMGLSPRVAPLLKIDLTNAFDLVARAVNVAKLYTFEDGMRCRKCGRNLWTHTGYISDIEWHSNLVFVAFGCFPFP